MGENEPYVLAAVVPERAHMGSETQFSADNQPKKRGRPRGVPNKMSGALKQMIVEVAEELGHVAHRDWEKLLCGENDDPTSICRKAVWRSAHCMKWPAAAMVRSMARPLRSLPPELRRAQEVGCCGVSPGRISLRPPSPKPVSCPTASSMWRRAMRSRCSPVSRKGCGMVRSVQLSPRWRVCP
jgi:hypothetical protein